MKGANRTTRQRIAAYLREESAPPGRLASEFDVTTATALAHVEHVAESLERTNEQLFVSPPTCRVCEFDDFDELINRPSRCPECKSENVSEPIFTIR